MRITPPHSLKSWLALSHFVSFRKLPRPRHPGKLYIAVWRRSIRDAKFNILQAALFVVFAAVVVPVAAAGESFELGAQLTGLHLHKIDEAPIGIGARFHYNVAPLVALDMEMTKYPENSSGNFGETAALFGIRAGKRFDRVGIFVKARMGVMHFGGQFFEQRLDRKTHSVGDVGGILEFYPAPRVFVRIDQSDTVIYYGGAKLFDRPNPDALGTVHNYQPGFGIGFRF